MAQDLVGRHVLVIEDEYFIADEIARSLVDIGADVFGPVPSERDALTCLEQERIDLAVLDINLDGKIGFAVADALLRRGVPFIFATGYGRGSIPARFDGVPLWEKPFDTASLVRSAAGMLDRSEKTTGTTAASGN